ncbi:MAG TPA: DUF932 domain-containing protein [Mesotoga prima]|uniref:DUF932 domain-containing protein n=1 Tax=Mesotoga prima TaxID=1184387 RepID=UPI002BB087DC|nr:DUF932 domain-containing protein [Mesotoga prima]HPE52977.1 DUF932 domain-containing protein [Mesotoga prima]
MTFSMRSENFCLASHEKEKVQMSYHTMQYLNAGNILVGNTKNNRNAWWYNADLEDKNNPTHFEDFIPLTTVKDRLFGWDAEESVELTAKFVIDGKEFLVPVTSFKAIGRSDWIVNGVPEDEEKGADAVLHVQGKDYGVHQLRELFINSTAEIVGGADNMGIESAGLLKWGRRAWITISIPENVHNDKSGLEFRPNLTVSTSFDSSLATSWTRTFGVPVCDNTLDYQLVRAGDKGRYVLKHTKNSVAKIKDASEALGLLNQQADEMNAALNELVNVEVSEEAFVKWLNLMIPVPDLKETVKEVKSIQGETIMVPKVSTNAHTIAMNRRDKLVEMWDTDERVSPWKGTKLGIVQLWNTYNQHERSFKASKAFEGNRLAAKVEGNMLKTLSGAFYKEDAKAIHAIDTVLDELVSVTIPVVTPQGKRQRAAASK